MATFLHFAPAVALALAIGPRRLGWRLTLAGAVCAVLPDADLLVVGLHLDRFSGPFGHRGFTHSIGFALLLGTLGALLAGRQPARSHWLTGTFLALCTASHPLLDGLIDRSICNAWLWPLDGARHCLPWRPIPLQGTATFGADRLRLELLWIGVPLLLLANAGMALRWVLGGIRSARWPGMRAEGVRPLAVDAHGAALPSAGPRARRQQRVMGLRALMSRLRAQHVSQRPAASTALPMVRYRTDRAG